MHIAKRGIAPVQQWIPVKLSATVYNNTLVEMADEGVMPLPAASGAGDTTGNSICVGLVIANNKLDPVFNSTYKEEYITAGNAADPHGGSAIRYRPVEGPFVSGDSENRAMVLVEKIYDFTVLSAPLWATSVGTAPTVLTATNTSADGLGITTNATDHTPVDLLSTIYCRSGANAGAYRIRSDASTTVATWDVAMKHDIAVGDTFVSVGMRPLGNSYIDFNSTCASFIDIDQNPATDYYEIDVLRLDLSKAGEEYAEFTLSPNTLNIGRTNV